MPGKSLTYEHKHTWLTVANFWISDEAGWSGCISGNDLPNRRTRRNYRSEAENMYSAILRNNNHAPGSGKHGELDYEAFCRWFVRFRGMIVCFVQHVGGGEVVQ